MKNTKTIFALAVVFGILLAPSFSSAQTAEQLQAQIQALLAQIQQLQNQLSQIQGQPAQWCHDFNRNLKIGDGGPEVGALKTALMKDGVMPYRAVTYDFDEETASYVVAFQQKYASEILSPLGLQYGTGVVGSATRAKLNSLFGCKSIPPTGILKTYSYKTDFDGGTLYGYLYRSEDGGKTWKEILRQYKGNITYVTDPKNPKIIYAGDKSGNMMAQSLDIDLLRSDNGGDSWVDISKGVIRNVYEKGIGFQYVEGTDKSVLGIDSILLDPSNSNVVKVIVYGGEKFTFKSTDGGKTWIRETATPSITVLSPKEGEVWEIGKTYPIRWETINIPSSVPIEISLAKRSAGKDEIVYTIVPANTKNVKAASLVYYWTIPSSVTIGDAIFEIKPGEYYISVGTGPRVVSGDLFGIEGRSFPFKIK
jgi:peptidoglycan hydrolase-like protein with peptidoglycan-binding domain